VPDGYQPEVLIGVDPGKQNVVTAVIAERVRRRQRKRGKRQKQWKRQRKRRKRRYLRGERVVQISTREYRHMAMMNKTRDWDENLKLRERDYAVVIDSLPSFHTAHVDDYLHRLGKFWEHLGFRLEFSAQHAFVRHRFLQDRRKMKALDALAKRIVPVPKLTGVDCLRELEQPSRNQGSPERAGQGFRSSPPETSDRGADGRAQVQQVVFAVPRYSGEGASAYHHRRWRV
jgi:hypothetical protein